MKKRKIEFSLENYIKIKDEIKKNKIKEKEKIMFEYECVYIKNKTFQKIMELIFFPLAIASLFMFFEHITKGKIIGSIIFSSIDLLIILFGGIVYYKTEYNNWYINKIMELFNKSDK